MKTIEVNPRVPDAIAINKLIMEYMTKRAAVRIAEIDAFVNSSNKTNLLVMEVFKGLIRSDKA